MSTPTLTPALADHGEREATPSALVDGPVFGILQPNGKLYRAPSVRRADPYGQQPTIWLREADARAERTVVAAEVECLYGMRRDQTAEFRVVRLELGKDGIWKLPAPDRDYRGHRPIDPDSGRPSAWPCVGGEELTVDEARQVMREHRACAGPIPCRARGRARALLARAGVMRPVDAKRAAHLWLNLDLPERAGR
ncbi:hypothetical protein [Nocardia paucivorans]|uniref:hypothetical protein n=1 Tax=Nocardia paucivorans TaxID=114259 RepID=UPI000313AAF2|nr:hypothetical protein [Nocardia paucivorans]